VTDYGHDLLFGSFITPDALRPDRAVSLGHLSERLGLDLVTVQDHPYQARHLDCWTLLAAIGAGTSRIRLAPNVANLPLRPPAVLARSAATLDLLTGGRVELGLGAGGFPDAIAAVGGPRLTPAQSVDALEEGIGVIRAMWDTGLRSVRVDGEHYRVRGAHPGPAPAHPIGIWVGAYKRRMLALTGRLADGWLPSSAYAKPSELPELNRAIDEAAGAAGREPNAIRRLYNIDGALAQAERLAELVLEHGMSAFILMSDHPDQLRRFAEEVAPATRELVSAERTSPPATASTVDRAATIWDESTRPTGPTPDPDRTYSTRQRAAGQHLVDVHDHLRSDLRQLRDLVEQVTTGSTEFYTARSHINTMTIRQNNWTVGAYCESYCRVVTTHHTLEDLSIFPHLRRADPALTPVIDRLEEEHRIIHDVLERVDRALVAFVGGPAGATALTGAVDLLSEALLSHLSYEERELVEPLSRLGYG
jgi:alkanesulfonate monooxygenase SsuD/methylene tetrahydromethanopterin reductase-like flavin-dependent oxidoreductase (luciferase family)